MRSRDNYKSFGFWGVLYLFYMYVFPSICHQPYTHMYHRRQLRLSLYVKAIICVGCALSRSCKERRSNAKKSKDSNPELSKKVKSRKKLSQILVVENVNDMHVRDNFGITSEQLPARKADYSPSNLPEANGSVGAWTKAPELSHWPLVLRLCSRLWL